jgi:hypothetical protein
VEVEFMSMYEIFANGGISVIIILSLIQIAPIKVNPWSAILRAVGRAINKDVLDTLDEEKANTRRYRIMRFDDEIRHNKEKHTEEHFNQILADIDYYEEYCAKHPEYPNNKSVSAIKNIKRTWEKCKRDNSFLI